MRRSGLAHPDDALRRLARGSANPLGGGFNDRAPREKRPPRPWWVFVLLFGGIVFGVLLILPLFAHHDLIVIKGIENHAFITKERLQKNLVEVQVLPVSRIRSAKLRIDNTPMRVLEQGGSLKWLAPNLQDGEHRLTVSSGQRFLWRAPTKRVIRFTVDSTPPVIEIETPSAPVSLSAPYTLRGSVERGSTVVIDGKPVTTDDGSFMKKYPFPPIGEVDVVATDQAGNQSAAAQPRQIVYPVFRGLHLSADAWNTPGQRLSAFRMADAKRINTVQLDLKDENGMVVYDSALAQVVNLRSGANIYDLRDAVVALHSRGIRVMGRVVVFRDPVFVHDAMLEGRGSDVVLGLNDEPFLSQEGLFANPLSTRVRDYNVAIAREAADAGVDDILFDFVSRPLGKIDEMKFAGALGDVNVAIDDAMSAFLRQAARSLLGTPTRIGVTVAGAAARSPKSVGQNVPKMAAMVDYVAPIVFPSKFHSGAYGIGSPSLNPATIVDRALNQFKEQVTPSGAALLPWLQDYSVGPFVYGQRELKAQVEASRALGIESFLVWDPKATYSAAGFPADAPTIEIASRLPQRSPSDGPGPTAATVVTTSNGA